MTAQILNHLWQSSLFAAAIWVLTLLFRNNTASVRHGLWLVASVKFLLPFSLFAALGRITFTHTVAASSMQALARIEPAAMPFAAAAPVLATPAQPLPWTLAAAAIWGLGLLAILLFWLTRAARLRTIVATATPLAIDVPVSVRATLELMEPGLAGILRPVILIPESLTRKLSKPEIDAILAHELCHLRRRDNLAAMVHMLVEALFWFHPLVWYIGARLVEEREQACDEAVLEDGKRPLDYAEAILKVCRLYFRSPLPCASGVSGADLDRRITSIMMKRDIDDVDPHKILLLAGLGAFALMAPLAIGGMKPAAPAPLVQSLVHMFTPAQTKAIPAVRHAPILQQHAHRTAPPAGPRPLQQRTVAAPPLDAGQPIIIVFSPQLPSQAAEEPPAAKDTIVCRPPQQLRGSRLLGPQVCMPRQEWDRLAAQGLQLMPDGRTIAAGYEREHSLNAPSCRPAVVNTSNAAQTLSFNCY